MEATQLRWGNFLEKALLEDLEGYEGTGSWSFGRHAAMLED
jgi:hypothetical protein